MAYGFPAHNDRLTVTPAVALAFSPTSRTYSLLWSLAPYAHPTQGKPYGTVRSFPQLHRRPRSLLKAGFFKGTFPWIHHLLLDAPVCGSSPWLRTPWPSIPWMEAVITGWKVWGLE